MKTSPIAIRVAREFRRRREAAGLTQAEVASRAGVTVETVARLERVLRGRDSANANPSLDTMQALANAMGCEAADLLTGGGKAKPDPLAAMLRSCKPDTRRRIGAVVEALIRDERKAG